ncbi:P-loop containing nucleoside triphosphate hydrolase protein [Periconia macrospinosa]|uniref:P-loop containing nucleoside triphosphate hydrolase protein n=1 Tax=Periconia macrospinosa TaxID=97972 RepID=A0A2V1D5U3_9PLEO|nr:P-loop containing nucleoside triphosphate hydrolase protein [Periconia macrospinosa]
MADNTEATAGAQDGSKLPVTELTIRSKEMQYMELLEKRIADLEARLMESEKGKKTDEKDDTNKAIARSHTQLLESTSIRYRQVKYTDDGLEDARDISEKEFAKVEQSGKAKEGDDIVWTRHFTNENKYDHTEALIVGTELQNLLKVKLSHDPRLHFPNEGENNDLTILSPFEPILHIWTDLEKLVGSELDSEEWADIRARFEESAKATPNMKMTLSVRLSTTDERLRKAKKDLTTLLGHIRATQEVSSYLNSGLEASQTSGTIRFEYLWTLFPPGELVYATPFMKQPQIFIVKESLSYIEWERDNNRGDRDQNKRTQKFWYLDCWSYDWDGRKYNRVPITLKFDNFQGAKKINTLSCYPLKYREDRDDPDNEKLKEKLIARGKLYVDYCERKQGKQMLDYEGDAISHGSGFQKLKGRAQQSDSEMVIAYLGTLWDVRNRMSSKHMNISKAEIRHKTGRVMIDFKSYLQHAPDIKSNGPIGDIEFLSSTDECHCGSCLSNERLKENQRQHYDDWDPLKNGAFTSDEQYLICPPRVLGYHLESRTWLELDVEKLQNISQPVSDSAFKKLQLHRALKELIKKLVQSHTSGTGKKPLMEDIVKGKGQGLVILLHGPPGVGKTLTAESVASLTGKPLFSITTSDIGLSPADVEHNLESLFELAARWHAVLLFDEADVFLESRSSHTSDLTRNALVSVLLRVLEYYSGILILTTNRINQFDIAVQSRVNLGIKYINLSMQQKQSIFKQFIDSIPPDKIDDKEAIEAWFAEDSEEWLEQLNGRQVRNVMFSAGNLAQREGECLRREHVEIMAKHTAKFQADLKAVVQAARSKAEAGQFGD